MHFFLLVFFYYFSNKKHKLIKVVCDQQTIRLVTVLEFYFFPPYDLRVFTWGYFPLLVLVLLRMLSGNESHKFVVTTVTRWHPFYLGFLYTFYTVYTAERWLCFNFIDYKVKILMENFVVCGFFAHLVIILQDICFSCQYLIITMFISQTNFHGRAWRNRFAFLLTRDKTEAYGDFWETRFVHITP